MLGEIALWAVAILWFVGFWTGVFVLLARSSRKEAARIAAIKQARAPQSPDFFFTFFRSRGVDHHIIDAVHDYFQGWIGVKDFPLAPQDDMEEVYRVDMEELEYQVIAWAHAWKIRLPTTHETIASRPLKTLEDLVLFLTACEKEPPKKRRSSCSPREPSA